MSGCPRPSPKSSGRRAGACGAFEDNRGNVSYFDLVSAPALCAVQGPVRALDQDINAFAAGGFSHADTGGNDVRVWNAFVLPGGEDGS
jgi:hypothetical protein